MDEKSLMMSNDDYRQTCRNCKLNNNIQMSGYKYVL